MKTKNEHNSKNRNQSDILIVDDHTVVRQGLTLLINQEPDLAVCAEAENAAQALEIIEKQHIDLAIVDISLNGTNGIKLTKRIKSKQPDLPVLILTMHDEVLYVKHALQAGAKGYITKHQAAETIITAIRLMLTGKEYISETITQDFLNKIRLNGYHY
jgi:DNA-binding NarL/FixJ family response regulator